MHALKSFFSSLRQGEHRRCGLADRESGRCHHGRKKPLKPLSRPRQLGRDAGFAGTDLGTDMVRQQAHYPLAVGGGMVRPLSSRPPDSRSIQSRPSGLSITSTIDGSSRKRDFTHSSQAELLLPVNRTYLNAANHRSRRWYLRAARFGLLAAPIFKPPPVIRDNRVAISRISYE